VLPKKPAYQRFIARQQLRKYTTVLEPLLGIGPRATMEVQLEAVFSMWSAPRLYHSSTEFQTVQLLASRRQAKDHQCNQWSETRRTTGSVIVVTVTVIVKVSANKTNIF
jgi:hypothetical protein